MFGLLDRVKPFFGLEADPREAGMAAAIEMAADNFSPQIRRVHNYQKQLKAPIERTANHMTELFEAIPGPMDVTTSVACENHLIKPFFINRDNFKTTVREDEDLNTFFSQNKADLFYALMVMDSRSKTTFDAQMQGEIIVRDIAVKMVNMSGHRFRAPAESMADAMQTLKIGVFQLLCRHALEIMLDKHARQAELEQLQEELSAKIQFLAHDREKMAIMPEDTRSMKVCEEAQALLQEIEDELASTPLTPDDYLKHFCDVLSHPDQYLSARQLSMKLDRMNNLVEARPRAQQDQIRVSNFHFAQAQSISAIFLKCDRSVMTAE